MHKLVRTLTGHAHRINSLALNCDYVLRTGAFQIGEGERNQNWIPPHLLLYMYNLTSNSDACVLLLSTFPFSSFYLFIYYYTHTRSSILAHTHEHIHTLFLTHTHGHTHTFTHSLSHTHTHAHTHTLSLALSHALTHSLSITHTRTGIAVAGGGVGSQAAAEDVLVGDLAFIQDKALQRYKAVIGSEGER